MFKRFATAAGILLALQVSSAAAGPCDSDTQHSAEVKAEAPVKPAPVKLVKADVPVKLAKAEASVEPVKQVKIDVPSKAEEPVKLAKAEASTDPVKQVKVDVPPKAEVPVLLAKAETSLEPAKDEAPVKRHGGGNRRGLTPAALALLDRIETQFGPVNVISGYRPGARIAGSGRVSRHASGNAIDFDAGSRKGAIVKWLIANHKKGGTMTYADMSHVHVDIGHHFVSLGSNSHRGGGRRYSRSRNRDAARFADSGYERRNNNRYGERRSHRSGSYQPKRYASGYATIY
jgi:hypothetical protein